MKQATIWDKKERTTTIGHKGMPEEKKERKEERKEGGIVIIKTKSKIKIERYKSTISYQRILAHHGDVPTKWKA